MVQKKTQKLDVILILIFLIVLITPVQGFVANSTTFTLGDMIQSSTGGVTSDYTAIPIQDIWTDSLTDWWEIGLGSFSLNTNQVWIGNYSIYFSAPASTVSFYLDFNEYNASGAEHFVFYVFPGAKSYTINDIYFYSNDSSTDYYHLNTSTPVTVEQVSDPDIHGDYWERVTYNISDMYTNGTPDLGNLTEMLMRYRGNSPFGTVYFDGMTFTNQTPTEPTYVLRHTQHYQQPVGAFESTTYQGALRWLGNTIFTDYLVHFIIQDQTCYDNDTLQVDTYFRYNNIDTIVLQEFVPCDLGCGENGVPVCINLEQEITYSYLGLITLILAILFFLFTYAMSKTEILKTFAITMAIFLTVFAVFIATIPGGLSDNFLVDMIEGASSSVYITFALIVLGLILFSFIFFFITWWRKKSLFQYGLEEEDFDE